MEKTLRLAQLDDVARNLTGEPWITPELLEKWLVGRRDLQAILSDMLDTDVPCPRCKAPNDAVGTPGENPGPDRSAALEVPGEVNAPHRFDPYEALDTISKFNRVEAQVVGLPKSTLLKYHTREIETAVHALRAYITGMER